MGIRTVVFLLAVAAVGTLLAPPPLPAQDEAWISVDPRSGALRVEVAELLDDRVLEEAVHEGLPLRISVAAQLWIDRFFDSEVGREEWKASVMYDPVTLAYEVQVRERAAIRLRTLRQVREHLQGAFTLNLRPRREGRYYYLATVEMETLSLSDLEELQRWLAGDLAGEGEANSGNALARGVRRLFVRALGLPARRLHLRTDPFDFDPPR